MINFIKSLLANRAQNTDPVFETMEVGKTLIKLTFKDGTSCQKEFLGEARSVGKYSHFPVYGYEIAEKYLEKSKKIGFIYNGDHHVRHEEISKLEFFHFGHAVKVLTSL
jgi:hypothetical protein